MNDIRGCLIPALDKMQMFKALSITNRTGSCVYGFKVHALADAYGAPLTTRLMREVQRDCWLLGDIKGLDTKDTIRDRAKQLRDVGFNALTIHALGRPEMVAAAVESGLFIICVTLLSDWPDDYVRDLFKQEPDEVATTLALAGLEGGASGIVCSPNQIKNLAANPKLAKLKFIVPGTRSAGKAAHDQAQVDTPVNTIRNGADYLVVGRQVTQAEDPLIALGEIAEEIKPAIEERVAAGTWKAW